MSVEHVALVVDEREVLAVGVDHRAEVGARRPHQVGHAARRARPRSKSMTPGGGGVRVDGEHVGAELGQHVRHDERRRAVAVVDHDLEPGGPDRPGRRRWPRARRCSARAPGAGTRCRRSRRGAPGGSPRGRSSRSILRWPSSAMSTPVVVEEADLDRLGVVGHEAHGDARRRSSGGRTWKRVTGTVATSRSSTLTPAALSPAIIARFSMRADRLESRDGDDRGALLERGAVGHGHAWRRARG